MPGKTEKIRRWQKAEIGYLERHRKTKSLEELARHFKTDVKTIKAKLAELKPGAAGKRQEAEADDPELKAFGAGLLALQKKDYAKAAKLFSGLLEDDDRPELVARARQFLAICRQHLDAATAKPGDEDAYLKAVYEKNRGNFTAALEICRRGGREKKDERWAYLAASIYTLEDRMEEAVQALSHAVELNPKNRIHAYHDADFAELRKDREHRHLFGLT